MLNLNWSNPSLPWLNKGPPVFSCLDKQTVAPPPEMVLFFKSEWIHWPGYFKSPSKNVQRESSVGEGEGRLKQLWKGSIGDRRPRWWSLLQIQLRTKVIIQFWKTSNIHSLQRILSWSFTLRFFILLLVFIIIFIKCFRVRYILVPRKKLLFETYTGQKYSYSCKNENVN